MPLQLWQLLLLNVIIQQDILTAHGGNMPLFSRLLAISAINRMGMTTGMMHVMTNALQKFDATKYKIKYGGGYGK